MRIRVGVELASIKMEKSKPLTKLQNLGVLCSFTADRYKGYTFPDQKLHLFKDAMRGVPPIKPVFEVDTYNKEVIRDLSEAVIYAQADAERAQILDKQLGKGTVIDGFDGILIAEEGILYHIIRYDDKIPEKNKKPTIRETEIPVGALLRARGNLTVGSTSVTQHFYSPKDGSEYRRLDNLLKSIGK